MDAWGTQALPHGRTVLMQADCLLLRHEGKDLVLNRDPQRAVCTI